MLLAYRDLLALCACLKIYCLDLNCDKENDKFGCCGDYIYDKATHVCVDGVQNSIGKILNKIIRIRNKLIVIKINLD